MSKIEGLISLSEATRNFGITVADAAREVELFSAVCKSIKERYHPLIYWMYEIGLLRE